MNVVLVQPEIPPNTGNVARLCAATNTRLHLIEPFGFKLNDSQLKRAGLDYWDYLDWKRWVSWTEFAASVSSSEKLWMVESGAPREYSSVSYHGEDYLVFGRETAGLPKSLLETHEATWVRIPMLNPGVRSLNLSNCVAIVLYEALRQLGF